jgi:hypothetical protein
MPPLNIYSILQAILETIEPRNRTPYLILRSMQLSSSKRCFTVSDEAVEQLSVIFSEHLLLAALDLIDRDCGKGKSSHESYTLLSFS